MGQNDEASLDPEDWTAVEALGHRMISDSVRHLRDLRDRPAWQQIPDEAAAGFDGPLPRGPTPLDRIYDDLRRDMFPYSMGNIHPRFWAWYMGAGNFTGALADFLAAVDGSNLGGGNTAAARIDLQTIDWMKQIVGFPASASGTLTSGGSMANMVALAVARNTRAGVDVRAEGITDLPRPLRFYTSDQAHTCHRKALEALGLGARALRVVPSDDGCRMQVEALAAMIAEDRAAERMPVCVIATAGTTNTGAIDDLGAIGDLCRSENLWFHVDGCIGAFLKLSDQHRHRVAGMERADSVALDPHKWLHTPFEAGCALLRDETSHFNTFEMHGEYLQLQTRGVSAGPFLADYGFELSRGFRALKIWMALREQGADTFGKLIDQNIAQARYLEDLVRSSSALEIIAPASLNILCFRYRGGLSGEAQLKALNTELMLRIQESGLAVPSDTVVAGRHCLRIAINNHRTRREDLSMLVDAVLQHGRRLEADSKAVVTATD